MTLSAEEAVDGRLHTVGLRSRQYKSTRTCSLRQKSDRPAYVERKALYEFGKRDLPAFRHAFRQAKEAVRKLYLRFFS